MKIIREEIDSEVLGHSVLSLSDVDTNVEFKAIEQEYIRKYDPVYAYVKIPIEDLRSIHLFETNGFRFVDFQIKTVIHFRKTYDTSVLPYDFELVDNENKLEEVLNIASTTFEHDRFTTDPHIGKNLGGERYRKYVEKSYLSSDEAVFRLFSRETGKTVAFKTHKYLENKSILFLLGGVTTKLRASGIGALNSQHEFNYLKNQGYKYGNTHISGSNYPVFNLEIGKMGFRVVCTYLVLRKLYRDIR